MSIAAFLERAAELAISRGVSESELFRSALDLFDGPALTWFRAVKDYVKNWEELVKTLKRDFQPSLYDDELWDEIRSRKQGVNERIVIYFATLENLFRRLEVQPDESTKLKLFRKNLLGYYIERLALEDVKTVMELRTKCMRMEEALRMSGRNPEQRVAMAKCLEPDLAYTEKKAAALAVVNVGQPTAFKCWNCQGEGHRFSSCPKPRSQARFCYQCGMRNVIKANCTRCIPKNGSGDRTPSGTTGAAPDRFQPEHLE